MNPTGAIKQTTLGEYRVKTIKISYEWGHKYETFILKDYGDGDMHNMSQSYCKNTCHRELALAYHAMFVGKILKAQINK